MKRWAPLLSLLLGLALAAPTAAARSRAAQGKRYFKQGRKLYAKGKYAAAVKKFKRALRYRRHPVILFNIALTSAMMKDHRQATRYGREYLKKATGADRVLPAVLRDSMSRVGVLIISSNDRQARVLVNGRRVGTAPLEHVVLPGAYAVTLQRGGAEVARRQVQVDAGREYRVRLRAPAARRVAPTPTPRPTPPPDDTKRARGVHWAWFTTLAVLTVGIAAGATGVSFAAKKAHDDFLADRTDADLRSKGIRLETTANVLWGLTAAAGATAVILAIFTRWSTPKKEQAVTPYLTPTGAGVTVTW